MPDTKPDLLLDNAGILKAGKLWTGPAAVLSYLKSSNDISARTVVIGIVLCL